MTLFVKVFITCIEFKECLVGMILGRIEKNEWKIGEKIGGRGVWLGEEKGEKSGGAWLLSLRAHQNLISPNLRENEREKRKVCFGQNCSSQSTSKLLSYLLSFIKRTKI